MSNKIILFVVGIFILSPLVVFAQTNTLQALQQQIEALQRQLQQLQSSGGAGSGHSQALPTEKLRPVVETVLSLPPDDDEPETPVIVSFDRDLYLGLRNDSDVSNLQEFLTDQGFYNKTISGNFFILTRNAVKKFQQAHGIKPSGYFGSLTRTVANKILTGEEVSPVTPPPLPVPVSIGHLNIDPAYVVLKIGETQRIRAIFTPPRPACLDANPSCEMAERAPYEVQASFVSDNPKIAAVETAVAMCASPPPGIQSSCPDPLHSVRGVSQGETIITATYSDYRTAHIARMKVSVGDGAVSQNLPPVISGLKGPTALKINEVGTWTIQAHDSENGSLAYHITWGDEEIGIPRASQAPVAAEHNTQTATFTHAYAKAGTFTPLFVVVDEGNLSTKTSASVVVGSSINYDACRLDFLNGSNITKRAIEDRTKCILEICDIYGPANLAKEVESKCVFYGEEIKRYTKIPSMFSIADVSGVQSAYVPGQQIKLTVKGVEYDGSPATSGEGFNVQTYIYDAARTKTYAGVNGTYNASTGYWDVLLDAPSASNVSYDLEVFLYCSNDSAVCASKYGRAAQVTKLFKFTLPSPIATDVGITVLAPNGGEQYQAGQSVQMPLKWTASCVISAVTIELYKSGNFVQMINSNVPAGLCSGSQETIPYYTTWQIPSTLSAGSDYKVRVSRNASNNTGTVFDDSDAPFSIVQP